MNSWPPASPWGRVPCGAGPRPAGDARRPPTLPRGIRVARAWSSATASCSWTRSSRRSRSRSRPNSSPPWPRWSASARTKIDLFRPDTMTAHEPTPKRRQRARGGATQPWPKFPLDCGCQAHRSPHHRGEHIGAFFIRGNLIHGYSRTGLRARPHRVPPGRRRAIRTAARRRGPRFGRVGYDRLIGLAADASARPPDDGARGPRRAPVPRGARRPLSRGPEHRGHRASDARPHRHDHHIGHLSPKDPIAPRARHRPHRVPGSPEAVDGVSPAR